MSMIWGASQAQRRLNDSKVYRVSYAVLSLLSETSHLIGRHSASTAKATFLHITPRVKLEVEGQIAERDKEQRERGNR